MTSAFELSDEPARGARAGSPGRHPHRPSCKTARRRQNLYLLHCIAFRTWMRFILRPSSAGSKTATGSAAAAAGRPDPGTEARPQRSGCRGGSNSRRGYLCGAGGGWVSSSVREGGSDEVNGPGMAAKSCLYTKWPVLGSCPGARCKLLYSDHRERESPPRGPHLLELGDDLCRDVLAVRGLSRSSEVRPCALVRATSGRRCLPKPSDARRRARDRAPDPLADLVLHPPEVRLSPPPFLL